MEYHTGTVVFGDWVIVEKIGEGASGQVFKIQKTIERNNSKTYVYSALKVIRIPRSASDVYEVRNASTDEKSVTEYFQKYVVPVRSMRSCLSMGISQAPKFMEVSYPKKSSNSSISMSVKRIFRKLLHGNAGKEHLDRIRS